MFSPAGRDSGLRGCVALEVAAVVSAVARARAVAECRRRLVGVRSALAPAHAAASGVVAHGHAAASLAAAPLPARQRLHAGEWFFNLLAPFGCCRRRKGCPLPFETFPWGKRIGVADELTATVVLC